MYAARIPFHRAQGANPQAGKVLRHITVPIVKRIFGLDAAHLAHVEQANIATLRYSGGPRIFNPVLKPRAPYSPRPYSGAQLASQ